MNEQYAPKRRGNKSFENVVRTDERYGHEGFWLGPRGRDYGNMLANPKPYQVANLYPDANASYWIAQVELPPGAALIIRGRFPYCRYIQFALYRPDPMGSFTATSEAIVDHHIIPDEGSSNPFEPGAHRLGENRDYTLRVVAEEVPEDPAQRQPNTLYAGHQGLLQMCYRCYLPDIGRDGSGDVGLPSYGVELPSDCELAKKLHKQILSAEEVQEYISRPMSDGIKAGMTIEAWRALTDAQDNDPEMSPATIPARNPPEFERYYNNAYSFVGVFKSREARKKLPQKIETGFGGDPVTLYMFSWISRGHGPVLVLRGKMPKFPDTFEGKDGHGAEVMGDWESRYWSVVICEAPPSGLSNDGLTDMQVPLDKDGNYTIVICRPEDRPENATEENGIAWMEWGTRGEGLNDPSNREDFGMLVFRYMYNNPNWKNSPNNITIPGTEADVMGPYYPRGEYTDKASFEAGRGGIVGHLKGKLNIGRRVNALRKSLRTSRGGTFSFHFGAKFTPEGEQGNQK